MISPEHEAKWATAEAAARDWYEDASQCADECVCKTAEITGWLGKRFLLVSLHCPVHGDEETAIHWFAERLMTGEIEHE